MSKTVVGIILSTLFAISNAEGTGWTDILGQHKDQYVGQKTTFIQIRNESEHFSGIVKVSPYDVDVDFPCMENYGTNSLWGRCNNLHFIDFDIESGNFLKNSSLDSWYLFIYKGFGNPNSEGGCDYISEEINKPSPFIPR
ncbi:hypothetical protein Ddc_10229 [Ditylenchus destructor]|nr:hypothetical protein Ddc_10229 [Ditylenchus destructor]